MAAVSLVTDRRGHLRVRRLRRASGCQQPEPVLVADPVGSLILPGAHAEGTDPACRLGPRSAACSLAAVCRAYPRPIRMPRLESLCANRPVHRPGAYQ